MGSVIAHRICSNVYFSQLTAGQIARGGGYSVRQLCTGCISCSPSEKCHLAAAQHVHAYSNWNWMYSVCHSVWLGVWVPWYPLYRIYICSKGRVTGPWPALVLLRLQSSVSLSYILHCWTEWDFSNPGQQLSEGDAAGDERDKVTSADASANFLLE